MKKTIAILLLSTAIAATLLVGCGKKADQTQKDTTASTKVETTVAKTDDKKDESKTDAKADTTTDANKQASTAASTSTNAKTTTTSSKSSTSGSGSSDTSSKPAYTPAPAQPAPKPVTPTPQPTPAPAKTSGIDWGLTNNIRNSKIASMYNGIKKPTFDQMLLDVVNGSRSTNDVLSSINKMSWNETWFDGTVNGTVKYLIGSSVVTTYSTKSSDPQMITSGAVSTGKMPTGDYRNFIVYYNANTQEYTLYTLSIKFQYEQ